MNAVEFSRMLQAASVERYVMCYKKYRTHPDKSVLFLPILDENQEHLLYPVVGYRVLLCSNTDNGCLPDVPAMNGSLLFLRVVQHRFPPHILNARLEVAVSKSIAMKIYI